MSSRYMQVAFLVAAATGTALIPGRPREAQAQANTAPALAPGSKLRIWLNPSEPPTIGTYVSRSDDSLVIGLSGPAGTRAVALRQVRQLQVSTGRRGHAGAGLGIGMLTGLVMAGVAGTAACEDGLISQGDCVTLAAFSGGVVGAFFGLIVGAFTRSDRWQDAPIEALADGAEPGVLAVTPGHSTGTAGFSVRIRF